ncbi:MAG: ribulose-phosphate 3-epimerase [Anaerolineae bacterium]
MPRSPEIIPSVLAADFGHLADQVAEAAAAGVATVQVDVMDGRFVPNISVGLPVVAALKAQGDARLDVHLMIDEPERYIDAFAAAGADVITVHVEATRHLHRVVSRVQEQGVAAGAALNPATPLGVLDEILPALDVVLLMSVNPGFGGQKFIASSISKVARLRERIDAAELRAILQVDGGVNSATAEAAVAAGADQLVAGTAVFAAGVPVADALAELRSAAARGERHRSPRTLWPKS